MRLVCWMTAISLIAWLLTTVLSDRRTSLEVLYGMIGPLAAVCATWVLAERVYRQRPEALTAVMIAACAGKLVFFLVYVTLVIRVSAVRPIPFVTSFTAYFIALYFATALNLRRLFWGGMRS